jgi:membrane-bound lytic murein transglycosylase C
MSKIKLIALSVIVCILSACSNKSKIEQSSTHTKDINAFNILINQIADNVQEIWGLKEVVIPGPKDYVQYSSDMQTRVHINFDSGLITIETLNENPTPSLQSAIISILLLNEPIDLLNENAERDLTREPFLYKQVLDETGSPIRWEWRAKRFANYLLTHQMKIRLSNNKQITYVTINLVSNHVNQRAHKFLPLVREAANRYDISESLILSIIKIESNYNPFAVSRSDAIGLMQVQRHTAGRDLHRLWGKADEPTRAYLFDPQNNINMGSAYLALIRDKYLTGIRHPMSMKYAMITAYNGGAGSVLTTFSADRKKAIDIINNMTPDEVYKTLTTKHKSIESRNYLIKVMSYVGNTK